MSNSVLFSAKKVLLSELDDYKLKVKFIICDFDTNENGVKIDRDSIDNWLSTLLNKPLVGKVTVSADGELDFTSHNVKKYKTLDDDGNEVFDYCFDTSAFGTFTEVGIEEIDGVDCVTATATVWRRFKTASDVLISRVESGTLHSSWELVVSSYQNIIENGKVVKLVKDGEFLANCVLGEKVKPAYNRAKVLQVAESDKDIQDAIVSDIMVANEDGENLENKEKKNNIVEDVKVVVSENNENVNDKGENVDNKLGSEDTQLASLTQDDIYKKLDDSVYEKSKCYISYIFPEEHIVYARNWGMESTKFLKFTYSVDGDSVNVSDPENVTMKFDVIEASAKISELESKEEATTEAMLKANEKIKELELVVSELQPYKDKIIAQEQERIKQETESKRESLKEYALKSNLISEEELESNDEIKNMIASLDEKAIKSIIADRFINKMDSDEKETELQVSSQNVNLESVSDNSGTGFSIKEYIGQ